MSDRTHYVDQVYTDAAKATGKTENELRAMGLKVFASMLLHVMQRHGERIWTVSSLDGRQLLIEVDFPPRLRASAVKKK